MTIWAAVGVTALLLPGCGGDDGGEPAGSSQNGGGQGSGDAGDGANGGDGDNDEPASPLTEYLGYSPTSIDFGGGMVSMAVSGGEEDAEATEEERKEFAKVEELIAQCMRDEGFEYEPQPFDQASEPSVIDEAYSLEPEEFAKKYGYGIATLTFGGEEEKNQDPNEKIRDGLSPSAQKAYDTALWGDMEMASAAPVDEGDVSTSALEMIGDAGCSGKAYEEVYGKEQVDVYGADGFESLHEDLSALYERVQNNQRVKAATKEWASCMADGGHPDFETPADASNAVFEKMMKLQNPDGDTGNGGIMIGPDLDVDPEKLAELQKYEIDLATVDFACQQEHYLEVHNEVAFELEQEFVDTHRGELERYRDEMAESGGLG